HGIQDHGGAATVFPQSIGMASTWDPALIHQEADAISTEARGIHNDYVNSHNGNSGEHHGLSFYSPNINITRDPRWGRAQETYGEDPFLISQMAVAFIHGLQGDDPHYYKTIACAKHYAVHDGPESDRRFFNAKPPERDLYETYLPAFEAAVKEGHVGSAMGAYSSLYGIPDCANEFLLTDLLRKQWGFDGFVTSDGGAIWDIWGEHEYMKTPEEITAAAVKAGCDLCSGVVPRNPAAVVGNPANWSKDNPRRTRGGACFYVLPSALKEGLISEKDIDLAVTRELTANFRLGMYDPPSMVPWSNLSTADVDTPEHRALALKVSDESIVLLKNDGLLPLDPDKIKRIAVIGPNADIEDVLDGSYHGKSSKYTTILAGIKQAVGKEVNVEYQAGCPVVVKTDGSDAPNSSMADQAVAAAKSADVVIYVGGINPSLENEEQHNAPREYDGFYRGDRTTIELPAVQENLIKALAATGKPMIFINCSGSAMAMPWEAEHLSAIMQAWYSGQDGGQAVADVLFGNVNPSGKLPITFYRSTHDLPSIENYSMKNRTYRYFTGKPLFAFGHGLSYTHFEYADANMKGSSFTSKDSIQLSFTIKNAGKRDGDEIAQVYYRHLDSALPQAQLALCGFTRTTLAAGKSTMITLDVPAERFRYWNPDKKQYVVEPGHYELLIGAASDDIRLKVPVRIAAPE
ncbi:MAG TPA: glycoside hydrolase family 3 C-terminal domain-containing protein, partial [Tepidisphaeraceae bacterium]